MYPTPPVAVRLFPADDWSLAVLSRLQAPIQLVSEPVSFWCNGLLLLFADKTASKTVKLEMYCKKYSQAHQIYL